MGFQTVFQRYELKYLLTPEQKEKVLAAMQPYMKLDKYGRTTIRNLYYDTDTYLLIRRSIEKPEYKEKLRIRSYSRTSADSVVFVELKKKYKHVVYKRRVSLPYAEATAWLSGESHTEKHTQIADEIDYFMELYGTLHGERQTPEWQDVHRETRHLSMHSGDPRDVHAENPTGDQRCRYRRSPLHRYSGYSRSGYQDHPHDRKGVCGWYLPQTP